MKAKHTFQAGCLMVLWLVPTSPSLVGADPDPMDACLIQARTAYFQALELCQLAADPNPRLRCYEAAKAVYVQILNECFDSRGE